MSLEFLKPSVQIRLNNKPFKNVFLKVLYRLFLFEMKHLYLCLSHCAPAVPYGKYVGNGWKGGHGAGGGAGFAQRSGVGVERHSNSNY